MDLKRKAAAMGLTANTNILFADIAAISEIVHKQVNEAFSSDFDPNTHSMPGMIINMKSKFLHLDQEGRLKESHGGRLESMMQGISEFIVDTFPQKLEDSNQMRCFVAYEKRQKVISVTKNKFQPGKSINETPKGVFTTKCTMLMTFSAIIVR